MIKNRIITNLSIIFLIIMPLIGISFYSTLIEVDAQLIRKPHIDEKQFDSGIILGSGIDRRTNDIPYSGHIRMNEGISLYSENRVKILIFNGGFIPEFNTSSSRIMSEYAKSRGIPKENIEIEENPYTTFGEAYYTKKNYLEPKDLKENIIVTNRLHMPRSELIFRKVLGEEYTIEIQPVSDLYLLRNRADFEAREKTLYFIHKVLLTGIEDGDHEGARKRLEPFIMILRDRI